MSGAADPGFATNRDNARNASAAPAPEVLVETPPLERLAQAAVIGLFFFALVGSLSYAKLIALPLVAGALIGLVVGPTADRMRKFGVPASLTYSAILLVLGGIVFGLASAVYPTLSHWIERAPELAAMLQAKFSFLQRPLEQMLNIGAASSPGAIVVQEKDSAKVLAGVLAMATPALTQMVVFLFSLIFFLAGRVQFRNRLVMQFHDRQDRLAALRVFSNIENLLLRYFGTVTLINAAVAVLVGVSMALLGMGSPLAWGFLAFVFNFLPMVGPVILKAALLVAGLVVMPDIASGVAPAIVYTLIVTIESNYVTPTIVGGRFTVNPFVVFLAVIFWSWLWGFFGALLAMPLVVVATTIYDAVWKEERTHIPG